jgi:hypothetical protein
VGRALSVAPAAGRLDQVGRRADISSLGRLGCTNWDLHGWTVSLTPDLRGLAVSHGQYSVPVMLGKQVSNYIEHGMPTWP